MHLITSEQIRACRAILKWSGQKLADESGVGTTTLSRIEREDGFPDCRVDTLNRIRKAFEDTNLIRLPDAETIIIVISDNK